MEKSSPFLLANQADYIAWREWKLENYPKRVEDLIVEIADPCDLSNSERKALLERCHVANMVIYTSAKQPPQNGGVGCPHISGKADIHALGMQFGLKRLDHNPGAEADAITAVTVQHDTYHREYIPYTNKAIAWHTDGYYNTPEHQVNSIILHCVQPAATGGRNRLVDHELAYMALRDHNPDYIRALMHPQTMIIPANITNNLTVRPSSCGPVFSVSDDGNLHMRYTDRGRNISWRNDALTQEAVGFLKGWLQHVPCFYARLEAGQGLLANNVLHTRSAFVDDDKPRLLYRARYYDRISGT